ncbi:PREDICTED: tyrosyl-DNA phosphodiesterase 1 [Ipomoea nil]|uniref:tyrosyl-DNA phosphodiesterase 1 n=1 Tax=Ipomoea nil TaxID=35883 RepID=UPI0009015E20|nr:PREDICTED: tyrosyl-DNA phosphodiesterase 1 [Ipomoea nil]
MAHSSQVAFLTPLNDNLEEEEGGSIPKIPINEGSNCVGRSCVPVNDKRLSRKHLTVNATSGGSAEVLVESTNPVVIRSKGERKKLLSGERWKIENGDVVELIPGHYYFRYNALRNENSPNSRNKRPLIEESNTSNGQAHGRKKTREVLGEASLVCSKNDGQETESSEEAIRHFVVPKDKLPQTFRLLRVRELPAWANTNAVSIHDIIQGDVLVAILSNYMVDIDWLLSACPALKKIPQVLVVHGGDGTMEYMKRNNLVNWILHKPALPISYGTHHSKAMFLVYPKGVRIVVHTANLIHVDWNNKSQGLWVQDFPWKDQKCPSMECGFERDLIDYLSMLKWPEFTANIPALGNCNINSSFFKKFDYSSAGVRLIASVPGYHSGPSLKKWGHMKLRTVLQECTFSKEFQKSPLVYQFSSLGSLDEKWMTEFASSLSAGKSDDNKPLGIGEQMIVWPTVEDVRCSLEGYAAGSCIPSPLKNVEKEFLKKYWAKWKASHTGRGRAMPHIKTFVRYSGQNLAWMLLTSANLSKAAWGALQKNNSQLMIRSYELGVLFLPSVKCGSGFSCTDNSNYSEVKSAPHEEKKAKLVTLAWRGKSDTESAEVIKLPLPYELPPRPYSPEDVPWSWDRRYTKKDVYGKVWPR